MNKILCAALIICTLASTACSSKSAICQKNDALEQFRHIDEVEIVRGADRNFNDGDKRLLGVQSVGLYVPAFAGNPAGYRFGIRVINGTSDAPCDDDEAVLNKNAAKYSSIYNKEMLSKVASKVTQ